MRSIAFICLFFASIVCFAQTDRALIVGISQYTEVNSLKYADADANQYAQYLIQFSNYNKENVNILTNLEATKKNIENQFQKIIEESNRNPFRNFLFVYAGHGIGSKLSFEEHSQIFNKDTNIFLVPSDAKLSANSFTNVSDSSLITNSTFITTDWLAQSLSKIKAEKITIVLDSCYSGNQQFFQKLEYSFNPSNLRLDGKQPPKMIYIASSRDDQEAAEYDELGHGALSYAFFEFFNIKRREADFETILDVSYLDFSKNISKLFSEVQISGKSLDNFHQPLYLGLPVFDAVASETFLQIRGGAPNQAAITSGAKAKLLISTGYSGYKLFVNGAERKIDSSNLIEIPPGRHLFEYYIPETGYRFSFVRDLVGYQVLTEKINHLGKLTVSAFSTATNSKLPKASIEILIDGKPYGIHNELTVDLTAGTHVVEVKYLDAVSKKSVEIRPDSPLKLSYTLEPKKSIDALKNIKSVVF